MLATLFACTIGYITPVILGVDREGHCEQAKAKAVAALEQLGARISRDDKTAGKPVVEVDLSAPRSDYSAEQLRCLTQFPRLKSVKLTGFCVNDDHLEVIACLSSLEKLEVWQAEISDTGAKALNNLGNLKELRLVLCCAVTDDGISAFKNLKNLESLWITEAKVTGSCFRNLKAMTRLKELELRKSSMTDEGLQNLKVFPSLEDLSLNDNYEVSDKGLTYLRALPKLRALALSGTLVTPRGLAAFRAVKPRVKVSR